ncbi:MAG TPA: DUF1634 domain-containing protein [Bryobacteraceae bacterium]|nr:DUF1634 domain-containing protein [Bryobacteraceae bacterium]
MTQADWTDRRVETIVGNLLRAGVILSALVVLAGGIIFLSRHAFEPANYRVFQGEPSELRHFRGILRAVAALRGRAIIQLGLLLLIATPIARVAFSMFGFAEERDRLYVAVTGLVLAVLLYSFLGSP